MVQEKNGRKDYLFVLVFRGIFYAGIIDKIENNIVVIHFSA